MHFIVLFSCALLFLSPFLTFCRLVFYRLLVHFIALGFVAVSYVSSPFLVHNPNNKLYLLSDVTFQLICFYHVFLLFIVCTRDYLSKILLIHSRNLNKFLSVLSAIIKKFLSNLHFFNARCWNLTAALLLLCKILFLILSKIQNCGSFFYITRFRIQVFTFDKQLVKIYWICILLEVIGCKSMVVFFFFLNNVCIFSRTLLNWHVRGVCVCNNRYKKIPFVKA